jgi:CubicO group peptidase (beta-lactamase class C family)
VQLLFADERGERGKEHCVLARRMRLVHANEQLHRLRQLLAVARAAERGRGPEALNLCGQLAPRLMLLHQNVDELDHFSGLLEAREDELLLVLLVIILDEGADDLRRLGDDVRLDLLIGADAPNQLAVDEQKAAQHPVLAHQIFDRRDLVLFLFLLLLALGGAHGLAAEHYDCRACACDTTEELPPIISQPGHADPPRRMGRNHARVRTMTHTIDGHYEPRFAAVRQAFEENFVQHGELGAAVAVTLDGRSVVDLWGGHVDKPRTTPWRRDTLVNCYSTTKGITAICAHRLVDQGALDLDDPVTRYWPEFNKAGKQHIRVRELLNHRAGLPALHHRLPPEAAYDWPTMIDALAAEEPWWTPGSAHGYHAMTFGWLVGEVLRRASGRTVAALIHEELARPLGIDFFLGVPPEVEARVSDLRPSPPPPLGMRNFAAELVAAPQSMTALAFTNPLLPLLPDVVNSRAWRAAELPAVNGHTNARALARLYGALASGGSLDDYRVLTGDSIAAARKQEAMGKDLVLGETTRFGPGFMLSHPEEAFGPNEGAFGHPGGGGSIGFADPEAGIGFGYTPNKMGPHILLDPRATRLIDAVYSVL